MSGRILGHGVGTVLVQFRDGAGTALGQFWYSCLVKLRGSCGTVLGKLGGWFLDSFGTVL